MLSTGRTRSVLDPKRVKLIEARLHDFPEADLIDAVQGWDKSPHHRGDNDRHTIYNDLALLLRDAAKVELFRDLQRGVIKPYDETARIIALAEALHS